MPSGSSDKGYSGGIGTSNSGGSSPIVHTQTTTTDDQTTTTTTYDFIKINNEISSLIFQPGGSYTITFSTNVSSTSFGNGGYYIHLETDKDQRNFPLTSSNNNSLTINPFPNDFKATTGQIKIYGLYATTDGIYILPGNEDNTISGEVTASYNPPFIFSIDDYRFDKCTNEYVLNPEGQYIFVSKLKLSLLSGIITSYTNMIINKNQTGQTQIQYSNLNNLLNQAFNNEYYDTTDNHLFGSFHTSNDTFSLTITANTSSTINTHTINNLKLTNAYTVLTLVGATNINNRTVYGGIAIGKEPTVKDKGFPIFECDYPAYFNGHSLGYFSDPTNPLVFDPDTVFTGVMASNRIGMFSIFLGEPIYTNNITVSGSIRVYASSRVFIVNSINVISVNSQTGVINCRFSAPVYIDSGPISMIPEGNFSITFK